MKKLIILMLGIFTLIVFSIVKANASDDVCIFKNIQKLNHKVKIQTRDCSEYLKAKDCQENWQVQDMYKYANSLARIAKKASMTPYKTATRKTRTNCHLANGNFIKEDEFCNAMVAKEVILSYAPSNCEQLACPDNKDEEGIFNKLVKRYNKCYIYNEKQEKKNPWYVIDAKPMTDEEYEKTLSSEELTQKHRREKLSAEYKSGKYYTKEEKIGLIDEKIAKKELYFEDITKDKAESIIKSYPNDEDNIRKNIVGGEQYFYNVLDFIETTKCVNITIDDTKETVALYDVIMQLGQSFFLKNEDYFVSIKEPHEVAWVAKQLDKIDDKCLLRVFKEKEIDLDKLPDFMAKEKYGYFLNNLKNYKEFWNNAVKDKKYMLFVMDLY
jgi:hypothetical protein